MTLYERWTPAEQRVLAAFADHGDIILSVREMDPWWSADDADFEDLARAAFGPVVKMLVDDRDDAAVSRLMATWDALSVTAEFKGVRIAMQLTDPTDVPTATSVHQTPRGAAPTGPHDGVPAPRPALVEEGTHGPTAPRGHDDPDHRPADPAWWPEEHESAVSRAAMLGAVLIGGVALAIVGVVALVLAVAR